MATVEARNPADALRDAVAAERARLGSVKAAVAAVARQVGLTPRRVAAAWWGQAIALTWDEGERVLAAQERRAAQEIAELEARLAALRARMGVGADGSLAVVAGGLARGAGARPARPGD